MQTPVELRLRLACPTGHLLAVEATLHQPNPQGQVFSLPCWIPGSYMLRDFSQNLISLKAQTLSGKPLKITSLTSSSWQLEATSEPLKLSYEIYAFDLSVRTAFFNTERCFFNGTSCFVLFEGQRNNPHQFELVKPEFIEAENWQVATGLTATEIDNAGYGSYLAQNYDELIDCPFELGKLEIAEFDVLGVPHKLAITGHHTGCTKTLVKDLTQLCAAQIKFFGEPAPFDNYTFLLALEDNAYGGLEHCNSTALLSPRANMPVLNADDKTVYNDGYLELLELCSHEYFHSWNVKRIQPKQFQQPDLSQPAHTYQLWWFEGATSYYDQLFLYLADLVDLDTFLNRLAKQLTSVYRLPGRFKLSVAESSFHAWTKLYLAKENAPNSLVSYYSKGALLVMALDLKLRSLSANSVNLHQLTQLLWNDYGLTRKGLAEGEIEQLAAGLLTESSVSKPRAQQELLDFMQRYLHGTEDLPLEELLAEVGIHFSLRAAASQQDLGGVLPKSISADNKQDYLNLGANLAVNQQGLLEVKQVYVGSPAYLAGLSANDELLALDSQKITSQQELDKLLANKKVNDELTCHYFRNGKLKSTCLTLTPPPIDRVVLTAQENRVSTWPR